ncbi:MAG TPA: S8 family serine peptidase, partial [Methylomirabilota bacterium]|nr:S8 family serine peptidase [Methylomirabilota bacterium]
LTLRADTAPPSELKHGTAVVAMLIGAPGSRVPGLVPEARVVAADPFTLVRGDERTDAFGLIEAMDALADAGVHVMNLSLAGPDNKVLAARVSAIVGAGTTLVAAVGNAGPRAAPLYPAAYGGVIGVTAVDARGQTYRRALQGPQVDFAAPGVSVSTAASISGVRPQTGTSFATPFVTAAVAMILASEPGLSPAEVEVRLAKSVKDLGDDGRDPTFGHGLLQAVGECVAPDLVLDEAG